jgi:HK97 gp10 family phage protein
MSTDFEVEGLDSLLRKLENLGKEGAVIKAESLKEAVEPVLKDMKNTTKFKDRTGKLRESLKVSPVKKTSTGLMVWIGDVDNKTKYSWYVEYGSTKSKPHDPREFIRVAYTDNKDKIFKTLKEKIEENLNKL